MIKFKIFYYLDFGFDLAFGFCHLDFMGYRPILYNCCTSPTVNARL